ncbi:CRISPR-associated endonuclease Cas2 [Candidatus Amarolinea aalborgensis]|jgi:CRISPR-associated protein Cas2|uniref:CRISPR-associated endonuclease Cas2 n=1 Tax=Candidatus Amarolinea aalborgensis TaxID=2249329 RepID=UPI003BF954E8
MMVVITYDVNTETSAGRTRLRKVARQCTNYGQRVQYSVFECLLDAAQLKHLQHRLRQLINPETDSLRFYYLKDNGRGHVEHFGAKAATDLEGPLVL